MRICDILQPQCVELCSKATSKPEVINRLVELVALTGCLNDRDGFCRAVFDREEKGSTGLGEGVAIPHARSAGVTRPGLAAMVVPDGVDFASLDGKKSCLFFLIASPEQASDIHMNVLARLSTLLVDENFRNSLISCTDVRTFLALIDRAEKHKKLHEIAAMAKAPEKDTAAAPATLVAVTACPAGLSHTYMAAEALEQKARELGVTIKVEADGAAGDRNPLLPRDIAEAKAVIVAADRVVQMDRFIGKPLVRTGVMDGIKHPDVLIRQALSPECPVYRPGDVNEKSSLKLRLYRHLMSGLAYIMPIAATAGIVAAISRLEFVRGTDLGTLTDFIGFSIGALLLPILSAFIAFSIGGRTALVAGITGGVIADMAEAGVLGAVVNGFIGGGLAYAISRFGSRFLRGHDAMLAMLVYPLFGALGVTLLAQVTSPPCAFIDGGIDQFFENAAPLTLAMVGAVFGGMMSADMGGPLNKLAYACGVLLLADCLPEFGPGYQVMAAVMAGGMVPPVAAGVAALLFRTLFSSQEQQLALIAIGKGACFITEGVLPYLHVAPLRMKAACIAGSAAAGALSMCFNCGVCAPHGGIFIIPFADHAWHYLGALAGGTLIGVACFVGLRYVMRKKGTLKVTP